MYNNGVQETNARCACPTNAGFDLGRRPFGILVVRLPSGSGTQLSREGKQEKDLEVLKDGIKCDGQPVHVCYTPL